KLGSTFGARAHDFAAVFFYEPGAQEFFVQPESGKCLHAERQQRLADVKSWKLFALEKNHATSGAREQRGGRAAGRAASYDRDIVHRVFHLLDLNKISWVCCNKSGAALPHSKTWS